MKRGFEIYRSDKRVTSVTEIITENEHFRIHLKGLTGSASSVIARAVCSQLRRNHLFILNDKETAAYFYNDLENLWNERELDYSKKHVLFFPTSYKKPYEPEQPDNSNLLSRSEVLNRLSVSRDPFIIVSYPEALCEKVVSRSFLSKAKLQVSVGEKLSLDFLTDIFSEYEFERTDFVIEAGQFSIRGGIVDVFSFADELPYRIEFDGDEVESIRRFEPSTQLSKDHLNQVSILPNVHNTKIVQEKRQSFISLLPPSAPVWFEDAAFCFDRISQEFKKVVSAYESLKKEIKHLSPEELYIDREPLMKEILHLSTLELGSHSFFPDSQSVQFNTSPQPPFHKNFELLKQNLEENYLKAYGNVLLVDSEKQAERIARIFQDILPPNEKLDEDFYHPLLLTLHEGFIDHDLKTAWYTDHQIFERYHRFQLRERISAKEALTLKEIYGLQPGDYITHIDHGIGRFDGLERIENNGKIQEALRIIFKNNDLLYVNIHSLHRIAKYVGKEGTEPPMNRLGSNSWHKLKETTKKRVKDIAKDLIKLYAQRRAAQGFAYSPDTYLQTELEASFIFEDTPDQIKSTQDVKKDMEASYPMDRLICGDVGFGKTEIAIRAAFKAVADSRQVGILVPTTILALQHYKTFSERLKNFPCKIDYLNRFKTSKQQKESLKNLEDGKIDIIIGTHRLLSQDVKWKNLGLLVIDEEQKFGVAAKEKLKQMKVNVDTLTLTATPIPRTLQFSMMGARDLSIIQTPPPNRYPVQTELRAFNETLIRDAIHYEVSRGGQVFFIHTRVQNIMDVAGMIKKYCPDVKVCVAHGQMDGAVLEKTMLDFIEGEYDVLVATTIVESGVDISNVNTIIINEAHHYGLSDLHQLRGRVGRSNKKAFCYLLAPPLATLTDEARKRLKAIEEFADLGSGFNIAMRDLDIRGAGNILGGEQSGFISDIGFEMYQKILDEAIHELKEKDFKETETERPASDFIRDCVIETDMEILIPDQYVNNTSERLFLYKELDSIESEEKMLAFQEHLIDRFGPIPKQTVDLFNTIRLRKLAREAGFEKLILKNQILVGYFISNPQSPFYSSNSFTKILEFVKRNATLCRMKESHDKLSLTFRNVRSVTDALNMIRKIEESGK